MWKENIIEINNLFKSYKDVKAVNDISFSVTKGELFAFLGVNRAGKSTTINILCSLFERDSGEIKINGLDFDKKRSEIKKDIGIVFQNSILDNNLTVKENLKIRASFYGIFGNKFKTRYEELDKLLDLKEIEKRLVGKLSGGQRRKVDIARGIIHNPKLLFLDEPTTGLDPQTRISIWKIIHKLRDEFNTTIFLTTHYMEEADGANNVVIIDHGKIIAQGTPVELKEKYSSNYIKIYQKHSYLIDKVLKKEVFTFDNYYTVSLKDSTKLADFIVQNKDILTNFEVIKGNMDDVFIKATGKGLNQYE